MQYHSEADIPTSIVNIVSTSSHLPTIAVCNIWWTELGHSSSNTKGIIVPLMLLVDDGTDDTTDFNVVDNTRILILWVMPRVMPQKFMPWIVCTMGGAIYGWYLFRLGLPGYLYCSWFLDDTEVMVFGRFLGSDYVLQYSFSCRISLCSCFFLVLHLWTFVFYTSQIKMCEARKGVERFAGREGSISIGPTGQTAHTVGLTWTFLRMS